jgi:DNA-binding CsgD family transcriptional regulator/PAS domain-containing protein
MDIEQDKLIDIRNRIYATLDDDGVIQTILKDLVDLVEASGAFFNVIGGEVDNALFGDAISHGVDIAHATTVEQELGEPDPWSKAYVERFGVSVGRVSLGTELCSAETLANSPWAPFIREKGLTDLMMATFSLNIVGMNRPRMAVMTFHRYDGETSFTAQDQALIKALLPDLQRVARATYSFRHAYIRRNILNEALSGLSDAIVIIDRYGNHIFSNRMAREAFFAKIPSASGRVPWRSARLEKFFSDLSIEALTSMSAVSSEIRRDEQEPYLVEIAPLPASAAETENYFHDHCVITIKDPVRPLAVREDNLKKLYGLTPSEVDIALALFQGLTTRQVANRRKVSSETVRSQVKVIYQKMSVFSRSELSRKLSALVMTP